MKNDVELFSRLHISCQTGDGNLEVFFQYENQVWPPAPSDGGRLRLRTGKSFRYLAAHQLATSLAPDMSCALPMFHPLTGCDTVSSFAGHGKNTAWSTWEPLPELTDALLMFVGGPKEIPRWCNECSIERFVILLFDRTSTCTKVDHARRKLFPQIKSVQQIIPPTRAALRKKVSRLKIATYNVTTDWTSQKTEVDLGRARQQVTR